MKTARGLSCIALALSALLAGCGGSSSSCDVTLTEDTGGSWWNLTDLPHTGTLTMKMTFRLKSTEASAAQFSATAADTLQVWATYPSSTEDADTVTPTFTASPAGTSVDPGQKLSYTFTLDLSTLGSKDTMLGLRPSSVTYGNAVQADLVSSCGNL